MVYGIIQQILKEKQYYKLCELFEWVKANVSPSSLDKPVKRCPINKVLERNCHSTQAYTLEMEANYRKYNSEIMS